MTSPLVAPREDTTRATSGVALVEAAEGLGEAIASGSWRDASLTGLGLGVELAAAVLDPFGALAAAGVGWLFEHVRPLSDLLDQLTGDPDAVAATARSWRSVAAAVRRAGEESARATAPGAGWTGDAADAFSRAGAARAEELRGAAVVADALGAAVDGAGTVVSVVREVVRELIAQLVATLVVRVPQWVLEEAGTLGIATPHVVASAVAVIARVTTRVTGLVSGLVRSLRALGDLAGELLPIAGQLFRRAPRPAPTVPAPTVAARATPGITAEITAPAHPFGPGTGRAVHGPLPPPAPHPVPPPTRPAAAPPDRRPPHTRDAPPSPEERAQISRIRAALEPDGPPAVSRARPPARPPTAVERAAHEEHLDRLVARYPERYDEFRYNDPDHRSTTGPSQEKEAKIALDMMESKRWSWSVRRPADSGDFIDETTGQKWDIKGFHSDYPDSVPLEARRYPFKQAVTPDSFTNSMEDQLRTAGVHVLLDIRKVDDAALVFMKEIVEQRGWYGRVEWYP